MKAYGTADKHAAKSGSKEWEEGKMFLLVEVSIFADLKCDNSLLRGLWTDVKT